MIRSIRHTLQVAVTSLFLLCVGASAAFAGPEPFDGPEFAPPAQPAPSVPAGTDASTQVGWMLTGVGIALAIAAVALIAVLWHRSHATGRRLATP